MGKQGWKEDAKERAHGEPIFGEMISCSWLGAEHNGGCASRRGEQECGQLLLRVMGRERGRPSTSVALVW